MWIFAASLERNIKKDWVCLKSVTTSFLFITYVQCLVVAVIMAEAFLISMHVVTVSSYALVFTLVSVCLCNVL